MKLWRRCKKIICACLALCIALPVTGGLAVSAASMADEFSSIPSPAPDIAEADVWYQPTSLRGTTQHDRYFTVKTTVNNRAEELYISFPNMGGFRLTNEIPPTEPESVEKTAIFEPNSNINIKYQNIGSAVIMTGTDGTTVTFKPTLNSWCLTVSSADSKDVITIGAECIYFGYNSDGLVRVKVELPLTDSEVIYGTGERFSGVNQNGKRSLMWNCDACYHGANVGAGGIDELWRGYKNVPILHSSRGYTLFYNSTCCAEVDIGYTVSDICSLDFCENRLDFYFWAGTMAENIVKYTDLTGKSYLPPKWAFEYQVGGSNGFWGSGKTDEYQLAQANKLIAAYDELGTPINAVYVEGVNLLGEENGVAALFKEQNIKMLKWNSADTVSYQEAQQLLNAESSSNLPYLRNTTNNAYYGNWIDYADANGIELLRLYLQKYTDIGIYGGMCDFAELVGLNTSSPASGLKGNRLHNFYTYGYAKGYNQAYNALTGDEGFFYIRGASAGTQRWTALWSGDQHSTWAGLKMQLSAGLSAASCGFSIWGTDLCGLDGTPTDELYCRALLMGLFSPILRTGGNISKLPTDYGTSVQNTYKKVYWLRESLVNKLYSSAVDSNKTGLPMMQAMAIAFPEEDELFSVSDQYLFCNDFLVNPVLDGGVTERQVALPSGKWYDFWTGAEISGDSTVTAKTTLEDIPVYVKSGAAVPMTLGADLTFGSSMTDNNRVETLLVTPPENQRVSVYNKDSENSVTYTNTPMSSGHFRLSATMGNDAQCLTVYGKTLNGVSVDGTALLKLDAKPENTDTVGYYTEGDKTLIYIGTAQWTDVDMYYEGTQGLSAAQMPQPDSAYFGTVMSSLTEAAPDTYYTVTNTNGVYTYTRNSVNVATNALSIQKNIPFLYGGAYKNFTLEFDYSFASGKTGQQWMWVTLGNAAKNKQSAADGSFAVGLGISSYATSANCQIRFVDASNQTKTVGIFDGTATHHAKITVKNGDLCVFIDGNMTASFELSSQTTGGYVGIGANYVGTVISDITLVGDGFAYFGNSGSSDERTLVAPEDYYDITENDGATRYTFKGKSGGSWTDGAAMLPVGRAQNFTLEFDYQHIGTGERYLWLNWGLERYETYNVDTGSARLGIGSRDNTLKNGHLNCIYTGTSTAWFDGSGWLDTNKTLSGNFDATAQHSVKLTVENGVITVDFDNGALIKRRNADATYSGGYVMIGANYTDTVIENIRFTDLDTADFETLCGESNTNMSVFYSSANGGNTVIRNGDLTAITDIPFLKVGCGTAFRLDFNLRFAASSDDTAQWVWLSDENIKTGIGISGYSHTETRSALVMNALGQQNTVGSIDPTATHRITVIVSGGVMAVKFGEGSLQKLSDVGGYALIGTNCVGIELSDIQFTNLEETEDFTYISETSPASVGTAVYGETLYNVSNNGTHFTRTAMSVGTDLSDGTTAYMPIGNAKNFYLEFDYSFAEDQTDRNYVWLKLGTETFGAAADGKTGEVVGIGNNKYAQYCLFNQSSMWRYIGSYTADTPHRVQLSVIDGVMNVKIDGSVKNSATLSQGYQGGYVMLGANKAGTQISNIYFESLDGMNLEYFDAFYTADLESASFAAEAVGQHWRYNSNTCMLERTGTNFANNSQTLKFSALTYNKKQFCDLDMRFEYRLTDQGGLYVVLGSEAGAGWRGNSMKGNAVYISVTGIVKIGPSDAYRENTAEEYFTANANETALFTTSAARAGVHTCEISVRGNSISVYIDGNCRLQNAVLSEYVGGYITFAANSEYVQFGGFEICEGYGAETLIRIKKALLFGENSLLFDYNDDTFFDIKDLIRYKKLSAS